LIDIRIRTEDRVLKKWGSTIILWVLLGVLVTMAASRVSLATETLQPDQPDWAGIYDIIINTAEGAQVPTEIELTDWGNGQMSAHGVFQGYSLNQLGEYSGDPAGEGLKAHFDIDFGLVKGFIDFTIRHTEGHYTIEGNGEADSIAVGKMAATFSGQKQGGSTPPAPAPTPGATPTPLPGSESPNYLLWAVGTAAALVLLWALAPRRRRGGSGR